MSRGLACVVFVLAAAAVHAAAPPEPPVARVAWVGQVYAPAPVDNPLKGFLPYRGTFATFPHSMEWANIPWNQLQHGVDSFTWEPLEAFLDDVAGRGHQAVFRIYADSPNTPSAIPGFLAGVMRHDYSDHSNGQDAVAWHGTRGAQDVRQSVRSHETARPESGRRLEEGQDRVP